MSCSGIQLLFTLPDDPNLMTTFHDYRITSTVLSENITNAVIHFVNRCYGAPMANKNDEGPAIAKMLSELRSRSPELEIRGATRING
jgi:hypothetical protein